MKLVEVKWEDATSYANQWMTPDGNLEPMSCMTVGYVVSKNKNKLVLAQSQHEDEVHNQFVIPRGCIKSIRDIT